MIVILPPRRRTRQAPAVLAAALVVVAAGCSGSGSDAAPLRTLPADAVAGLSVRTKALGEAALAADVPGGRSQLAHLLGTHGFRGGREREFFGRSATFSHVVARTLVFRDGAHGRAYVSWLRRHLPPAFGALRMIGPLALGDGGFVAALRGCGCHAEVPTRIGAWRRGPTVAFLLAGGPGVNSKTYEALARQLDRVLAG
jgi:hypothetical protein